MALVVVSAKGDEEKNQNPRVENNFGYLLVAGGPAMLASAEFDYFINEKVNYKWGIGLFGIYMGFDFHPITLDQDGNWSPYIGFNGILHILPPYLFQFNFNVPVGLQYMSNSGFSISLEVGYQSLIHDNDIHFWPGLRIGYYF